MRSGEKWTPYIHSATRSTVHTQPGHALPASALQSWPRRLTLRSLRQRLTDTSDETVEPRRHTDLRLLPAAGAAWITAAVGTRLDGGTAVSLAIALSLLSVAGAFACFAARRFRSWVVPVLVPLMLGALVSMSTAGALLRQESGPVAEAIATGAAITAELTASTDARAIAPDKFTGAERFMLEAELQVGTHNGLRFQARTPVLVIGPDTWGDVGLGDRIQTSGQLVETAPGDRAAALLMASTEPHTTAASGVDGYTAELRSNFIQRALAYSRADDGLLPGMVIGEKEPISGSLETAMRTTGLTHLTAVSGANCSYVLAFVFIVARSVRLPRVWAVAAGVVALIAFVLLVRPEPSVLRAAVMGSIGVFAVLTGRGKLSLTLLLVSIVLLLAVDPWLYGSYAFILSVVATSALVLFGPILAARLGRWMPQPIAQLIAVPLAAQIFCAPVLVLLQPEMPLYSVPANIAATPVVPFVTILGMAAVLLVAIWPPAAIPFVVIAGWGSAWVAAVAYFFESAPGAAVPWITGVPGVLLTGLLSAVVVAGVTFLPRLCKPARLQNSLPGQESPRIQNRPQGALRGGARGPALLLAAVGCVLGLVAALAIWPLHQRQTAPAGWRLAACDVGQGDGFALRTGPRHAMVIDTGPDPDAMDSCLDQLSVDVVDLLLITHLHLDHYGGAEGVFRDRSVKRLLYSSAEETLPPELTQAATPSVTPERLAAGSDGRLGGVSWTVLWPTQGSYAPSENDASAVLQVSVEGEGQNVSILFTGDIEEDSTAQLLRLNPGLAGRGVDILKVAHHGARNGGTGIIRATRPRLAMVSVGSGNDYGHPHETIVEELAMQRVEVARTDQLGSFTVTVEDGKLELMPLGP